MSIHPSAQIHPDARIGADVKIGAFSIIHAGVELGANSVVEAYCELGVETPLTAGRPLSIGKGAVIRSHSVFYASSSFGSGLVTGHRVTVRENTVAGLNLQIGTLCDIQGDCRIGDYVRFHSNVHIGKHSVIEDGVWIFPYVVLTNDPTPPSDTLIGCTIERFAAIATMSVILPGVRVGSGALVGAGSIVTRDVPKCHIVAGNPAKDLGTTDRIKLKDGTGRPAYPWQTHFTRGYPPDILKQWLAEVGQQDG